MKKQDVLLEIACALKDVFVAKIETKEETVIIRFVDGKTYQLTIQELHEKLLNA